MDLIKKLSLSFDRGWAGVGMIAVGIVIMLFANGMVPVLIVGAMVSFIGLVIAGTAPL